MWDPATLAPVATFGTAPPGRFHTTLSVLSDGEVAVACGRTVMLWNMDLQTCEGELEGHTYPVNVLAELSGGRLASGGGDPVIRIWDLATRACIRELVHASTYAIFSLAALGPNTLASGCGCRTQCLKIWDVETGTCARTLGEEGMYAVAAIVPLPDGRWATSSYDKKVRVWDLEARVCEWIGEGHAERVWPLVLLEDEGMVSGSFDGTIGVWRSAMLG